MRSIWSLTAVFCAAGTGVMLSAFSSLDGGTHSTIVSAAYALLQANPGLVQETGFPSLAEILSFEGIRVESKADPPQEIFHEGEPVEARPKRLVLTGVGPDVTT